MRHMNFSEGYNRWKFPGIECGVAQASLIQRIFIGNFED